MQFDAPCGGAFRQLVEEGREGLAVGRRLGWDEGGDLGALSTLRAYVEALGGQLKISAVFDNDERFPIAI